MNRSIFVRIVAVVAMALIPLGTGLAFQPAAASGTVTVSVQGQGSVTAEGINCTQSGGPDCSEFYESVEECIETIPGKPPICTRVPPTVVLTAGPDSNGYVFDSWTGCDSVDGRECAVTVADNVNPIARFRDAAGPSLSDLSPAGGIHSRFIPLSVSASDNSGTVTKVEFQVRSTVVVTDTVAPYSYNFYSPPFGSGPATITARAYDASGNNSSISTTITLDHTDPTLSVTSGPDGQTFQGGTQSWTFSATDALSPLTLACSVVPAGQATSYGPCSGGSAAHSVSNLDDGSYVFLVEAKDAEGNFSRLARTFSIDSTPPNTSITGGPGDGSTTSSTVTFGLAGAAPSDTFECRLYAAGTTAPAFAACSGSASHTASGLAGGGYIFEARATDAYGNVDASPVQRSFTVDAIAPNTTITKAPKDRIRITTRRARVTFGFTSNETAAHFQCRMDANAWASCTSPRTFRVGKGSHTFKVRAIDAAGNRDATPPSRTFRVIRS